MSLLNEMTNTINKYKNLDGHADIAADVKKSVDTLTEMSMYFASCAKQGKFLVPINNAYPFLMLMGKVVSGWLLLWQAGVAQEKLEALAKEKGVNTADKPAMAQLCKENMDAAFYSGKIYSARFFAKNVLPEVNAIAESIKTEDMSILDIAEESFAS
jgi:hypothetical protein